jgi:dienelactone hydrolase
MLKRIVTLAISLVIVLSVTVVAAQIDPITLPAPTGDYAVSRLDRDFTDESREEIFTEDADDFRRLLVTFYYPATPAANAEPAPYINPEARQALATVGIPFDVTGMINGHVYEDEPVASGQDTYPVLIFSPGFGAQPAFYSALLTELASQGYIIAVITHTYSIPVTRFPNGDLIMANGAGMNVNDAMGAVWFADAQFVLNTLETINAEDPILAGTLDLTHIGAFGHSYGGATAAMLAAHEERVLAGINMDGSLYGDVRTGDAPINTPFLHILSDIYDPSDEELSAAGITRDQLDEFLTGMMSEFSTAYSTATPGYMFTLADSAHSSFTVDILFSAPLFGGLVNENVIGSIAPDDAFAVISRSILTFFDQYVRGVEGVALTTLEFPAVEDFQTLNNAS